MATVLAAIALFFVLGAGALVIEALFFTRREAPLPPAPGTDEDLVRYAVVALRKGLEINNGWRDYGGHGLAFKGGRFVYGASLDGTIAAPGASDDLFADDPRRIEFESEQALRDWLLFKINEHGPCLPLAEAGFRERLALAARYGLSPKPIPPYPSLRV